MYFSDDDGATYFLDNLAQEVPFDHNGKLAFRAYVFRCQSGAPFVAFLGRPLGASSAQPKPAAPVNTEEGIRAAVKHPASGGALEVKKPGQTTWVPLSSPEGNEIASVKCPDGRTPRALLAGD